MSNDYFTHTALRFVRGAIARSKQVNDVFDLVVAGFDKLYSAAKVSRRSFLWGENLGVANTLSVTLPPPVPTAYEEGMLVVVKNNGPQTGPATLNVNGLGAKDIRRPNGDPLVSGDLASGQFYTFVYNGSHFRVVLPDQGPAGTVSAAGDGTVSAPGMAWSDDANTGFYRVGSGEMRVASDGADELILLRPSQATAEAGTDNLRPMTALRTRQHLTAQIASEAEAKAGTNNTQVMTPLRVEQSKDWVLLHVETVSAAAAAVDFDDTYITSEYENYAILMENVTGDNAGFDQFFVRLGNGGSVDSGASDYAQGEIGGNDSTEAEISLGDSMLSSTQPLWGWVEILRPLQAGTQTIVLARFLDNQSAPRVNNGVGRHNTAKATDTIRIGCTTVNNTGFTGVFRLYGLRGT